MSEENKAPEEKARKVDQAPQDVTSQDFFDQKAEEAKESGEDQEIDLTSIIKVEVLKDFGFLKKGDKMEISQSAFDTYQMSKDTIIKRIK